MTHKEIYEYTFKQMLKHIKESRECKIKYHHQFRHGIMPIIDLGDTDYSLYQNIVEASDRASKSAIVEMIKHLMECYEREDELFAKKYAGRQFYLDQTYDIMLPLEKKKIVYYFKRENRVDRIVSEYKSKGFDGLVIIHMNHYDTENYKTCILDANSLNKKTGDNTKHITLKDFFVDMFGEAEYDCFMGYVNKFNETAQSLIGFDTVLSQTEDNIEKFKVLTLKEIYDFKYEEYVKDGIDETQIKKIRDNYINRELYKIMLGESTFANSFLSSEWNYKIYKATDNLEQTGIIAGYLKSIEQLVFELARLRAGEHNITIRKENWDHPAYFTKYKSENINFSLGELEYFLVDNVNLFGVVDDVRDYIVETIKDWREKQRNGYFHKHNLKDINRVDEIRDKAIFLYFLLLGGYKIRGKEIGKLTTYIKKQESPKSEEQILDELTDWINEILAYDIAGNSEVMVFNLYDEADYGWSLQLTTVETIAELEKDYNMKECFSSGKDLFKWKSTLDEKAAQSYACTMLEKYLGSDKRHNDIKKFRKIAVWCRYGTKIVGELQNISS